MTSHPNGVSIPRPLRAKNARSFFPSSPLVSWYLGGCWFALLLTIAACGRRADIAGPIETTDFVIPADETVTATADTTINASNKIEIDGTLYIAPGANVIFKSPSVNINGTVQNLSTHVSWWRRTAFTLRRLPALITASIDRLLGRQPRYLNRGPFDCFGPTSRSAPSAPNPSQPIAPE